MPDSSFAGVQACVVLGMTPVPAVEPRGDCGVECSNFCTTFAPFWCLPVSSFPSRRSSNHKRQKAPAHSNAEMARHLDIQVVLAVARFRLSF